MTATWPFLYCDMDDDCNGDVSMIDERGYVYCQHHGLFRRSAGINCRKLRPHEINRLLSGKPLKAY